MKGDELAFRDPEGDVAERRDLHRPYREDAPNPVKLNHI
jgi:hypothetical protein